MPRFIARPVTVEAHQFTGDVMLWPEPFRLAVLRRRPDGTIEISTNDGARSCRAMDWVVLGPDGLFRVWHAAAFEVWFGEASAPESKRKR